MDNEVPALTLSSFASPEPVVSTISETQSHSLSSLNPSSSRFTLSMNIPLLGRSASIPAPASAPQPPSTPTITIVPPPEPIADEESLSLEPAADADEETTPTASAPALEASSSWWNYVPGWGTNTVPVNKEPSHVLEPELAPTTPTNDPPLLSPNKSPTNDLPPTLTSVDPTATETTTEAESTTTSTLAPAPSGSSWYTPWA
ncbi:hypothetical protein H0H87_009474 [Tephrocybe sp. NHM501043]|nr:hypothetical protein H0H87_009474 [Tephrocybe sp. NHM501043]